MDDIGRLFDIFASAYQRSLYALEYEQKKIEKMRLVSRKEMQKKLEKNHSRIATEATNNLMAYIKL